MSNEAITWAFRQDITNSSAKFVLVVLADHADENATCFPSQKKIARMTGMGERSVRRWIDWLVEHKLVTRSTRYDAIGRRTSDRYRLNLAATLTAGQTGHANPPAETTTGQTDRRPDLRGSPANLAGHEPSGNPSLSQRETESGNRQSNAREAGPIPPGFALSNEMRDWATRNTPSVDPDEQIGSFVDYWLSRGELRADWIATWRGWMRNRAKWDAQRSHRQKAPTQAGGGYRPFRNPADDYGDDPDPWS